MKLMKLDDLLDKTPFAHHPTRCCFFLPLRSGSLLIGLLLILQSVWFAAGYFVGIGVYRSHVSRGIEILYGFLFLIAVPIGLLGVYATKSQRSNLVRRFSQLYWLAISVLLILHFVDLILAYVWKKDIVRTCKSDLVYLIPANTSTVTVPYDPDAPTPKQIDDACNASIRLSLTWSFLDLIFIRLTLLVYFAVVVNEYSKKLTKRNGNSSGKQNCIAFDDKNPQFGEIESGKSNFIVSDDKKNPQFGEIESGKSNFIAFDDKNPQFGEVESGKSNSIAFEDKNPQFGEIEPEKSNSIVFDAMNPQFGEIESEKSNSIAFDDENPQFGEIESGKSNFVAFDDKKNS
ncbi:4858_t:CDS:2 [Ambispora gerdemannii]|uniref:4858_t:CDS:1 n=1 Tax=Ambispora gerdemannii TaxID=144530 RepID=A0A9N9C5W1_9GLOM|nr:4858_t:CDS:2 [Ambispora gerdemannii]